MPNPPILIFEDSQVDRLYPLTYSRAACELRAGSFTLLQRLQKNFPLLLAGLLVRSPLAPVLRQRITSIPINPSISARDGIILINARWLMLSGEARAWKLPDPDTAGLSQATIVWMHLSPALAADLDLSKLHEPRAFDTLLPRLQRINASATLINRPWDLLDLQRPAILEDFSIFGRANEAAILPGAHLLAPANIHLGKGSGGGVKIWPGAVLDAQNGPILIGDGTEIRPNAVLTGPLSIGPLCVIRTGADIREDSAFGPNSRVGGEIINSVFLGNANKQHHGFLGQSIIGEWANLGAGTTTSNLKNTYGTIKMPLNNIDEPTGRTFLGSIIADHAKLGIGTYLSTGSVIGFASHIITPRPPRFVPAFSWLTDQGLARANFEKIEHIAATVMKRRGITFTPADHDLFVRIATDWSLSENFPWPSP